jgi:hypothetical protein
VNVCDETVPDNRYVDGLPAYAQCDTTTGSIWSNNGIDTATSSQGDGWVRTQQSGGYQCTEWAYRYMRFRWGISYRHGNAQEWCDGDLPDSLVISSTPVHGDLIVFDGGVCGSDQTTGHIAVVDVVAPAGGRVTFVEENRAGRRSSEQSCALCYLHAVANDGTPGTAGAPGGGASGGMSGVGGSLGVAGTGGGEPLSGASGGEPNQGVGGAASTGGEPGPGGTLGISGAASSGAPGGAGDSARAGTGGMAASSGGATGVSGATQAPATGGAMAQGGAPGLAGGSPQGRSGYGGEGVAPGAAGAPSGEVPDAETAKLEGGMDCSVGPRRDASSGALYVALALIGLGRRRRARPAAV